MSKYIIICSLNIILQRYILLLGQVYCHYILPKYNITYDVNVIFLTAKDHQLFCKSQSLTINILNIAMYDLYFFIDSYKYYRGMSKI